ncbi:MAG TPA: PEP-CTERM sorting domain-containing protein [Terriglobia bacterium]|nr:PEP-CTERM sorting domain-containing protein [Terriglobia bacterium]
MKRIWLLLPLLMLLTPHFAQADSIAINFESLTDFDSVINQFAGLVFSNATVLTAGTSLNELEFPPHSGTNVIFDDGGAISITFAQAVNSVGGFFNYVGPLTLQAFDAAHAPVGSVSSAFNSNLALSGDAGSSANEFLSFASAGGFTSITITGSSGGGSFTLDDLTYTVPAPASLGLLALGIGLLFFRRQRAIS